MLAVSVDTHEDSERFADELEESFQGDLNFPFLEDKDHKVIDRYGLLNADSPGWPHPAVYVIDKKGIVRWRFIETDYTQRASNEEIFQVLEKIP